MRTTSVSTTPIPFPERTPPPPPRVPAPIRWTLENGLRIIAVPWTTLPQIAARLVVPAGSDRDPEGAEGMAAFIGAMLTEGSVFTPADELNMRLDRLGASLSVQVGHDFAELDLFLLAETLPEAMQLLSESVRSPAFPEAETERVRAETFDALDARQDEPANVADDRLAEVLFGRADPYSRPPLGTRGGVAAITREALRDLHERLYRPEGSALLIAGDFEQGELRKLLDEVWSGWSGSAEERSPPPATRAALERRKLLRVAWPDATQGEIRVGGLGMPRDSADWIPAAVANYLLGGSTITGRLGANLREDKGWTYGVRSGFGAALRPGGWVIETAVDTATIDAALAEIDRELLRLVNQDVSSEEIRRAKDALILSLPRAFETPGRIIGRFATAEAFGLGADYWNAFAGAVEAVTPEIVRTMVQRYFHPRDLIRVVVGPPESG